MVTPYRRDGHNPYSTIYVMVTQNAFDHGYDDPYNGNIIMNIDHGTYGWKYNRLPTTSGQQV